MALSSSLQPIFALRTLPFLLTRGVSTTRLGGLDQGPESGQLGDHANELGPNLADRERLLWIEPVVSGDNKQKKCGIDRCGADDLATLTDL
ncbi:hypothetical protein AMTR_s00168p00074090 [Amborella trichopoda]|uniref:Uncharacterized protein n=1 Tax=Amborella trichopoda TaxID=13333 RepID=W1PSH3_AMBTC|nr:hypothetical protein AMTR_s00168p00074090 [Amborella trichopoda]